MTEFIKIKLCTQDACEVTAWDFFSSKSNKSLS